MFDIQEVRPGWKLIKHGENDIPLANSLQEAKDFLWEIDMGLAHSFTSAIQKHNIQPSGHFLEDINNWFALEGNLAQEPQAGEVMGTPRVRELRDLHLTAPLERPLFMALSAYTTKSGKKGFALAIHTVNEVSTNEGISPQLGDVVLTYRTEEKQPGIWVEYEITSETQDRIGFLAEISSTMRDCYVLVHPGESSFHPGGGEPMPLPVRRAA